jgi:hypothetical protein
VRAVAARKQSIPTSSTVNVRKGDEICFDLPAQTAQADHTVSSAEPLKGSARLIGLGLLIELSEVGNDCDRNTVGRARFVECLPLLLAR